MRRGLYRGAEVEVRGKVQTKLNSKGRRKKGKNGWRQGRAKAWGVEGADEFKFRRGEEGRKNGWRQDRAKAWGVEGADEF